MSNTAKTALVTGANSGIGFEAAAQLAEDGYGRVILACRTLEKADVAKTQLIQRTGRDVFEGLAVDVSEPDSVTKAVKELVQRHNHIDVLILNAGMSTGSTPVRNSAGVELTFASTLIGHHAMTMQLLTANRLSEHARIVISGSEGARGNMPGMDVPDFHAFAHEHFGGDMEKTLETIARVEPPYAFKPLNAYVTAKVMVAWWAAALARRLPQGMTVNAVSPGSVPATNFARNMSLPMRIMMPLMMNLMRPFGMSGSVAQGARRYLDAANFDDDLTGKFFASPPGKLVGKLQVQRESHFFDEEGQEASFNVISRLAGVGFPAA